MWRCGNVGNVGQINISLAQWPHFAGRAYCIHTALHTRPSCEWSSQYSARHLSAHTRSDVFSERVSSLLWREYSDQGPGAVINIGPPLTRGHTREGNCIKLCRVRGGYGFTSEAMGRFLSVLFLACLNFLRAGRANGSAGHFSGLLLL